MPDPIYTYDPATGVYTDASGDPVGEQTIRDAVETAIAALVLVLMGLTQDLKDGALTLSAWRSSMRAQITAAHLAVGSLGAGGLAALEPATTALLDTAVKAQLAYLDAWAAELASSSVPMTPAALARAGLYAQAPRGTFQAGLGLAATRKGMSEESNLLHAAESCASCRAATAAGWVKIGVLPPVGGRSCLSNCRCVLAYRSAADARTAQEGMLAAAMA